MATHVRGLAYGRPTQPGEPTAVLTEARGTCSGKHRLLAAVAHECGQRQVELLVGIYAMDESNTPGVGEVLADAGVDAIPEAHCYLRIHGERLDFTGIPAGRTLPFDALVAEQVVSPATLGETKPRLHKQAILDWAEHRGMAFADAWALREQCIAALTA